MRNQFFAALQDRCLKRSNGTRNVRWWFSSLRLQARRLDAFSDEGTRPFNADPPTPTVEDPPVSAEFWGRLNVG